MQLDYGVKRKGTGTRNNPQGPAIAVFVRKDGTRRDPAWCTPALPRPGCGVKPMHFSWGKKDSQGPAIAVFFGKTRFAGTCRDRDSCNTCNNPSRVWCKTYGNGDPRCVFLGGRRDPQSAAIVAFYGKTGHAGGLGGKVAWHSPKPDGTRDCRKSKAADVVLLCLDV